ncbi:hypothetical protein HDU86_007504 [Geranomyces michiganensis]|nr:hypothetical protein HDU86_007504 [Geranomyces michiganensis]
MPPGAFTKDNKAWSVALRAPDATVHSITVLVYGNRFTDSIWPETFIDFRNKDQGALYEALDGGSSVPRGYLPFTAGLNATGVQIYLDEHHFAPWNGPVDVFRQKRLEKYYKLATTTYLGADDTDLIWAMGWQNHADLLLSKELMVTISSFTVETQTETFSRTIMDVGNSILAPASILMTIVVILMGSGKYQPIGLIQKHMISPISWARRQYGIVPGSADDVDARLQNVEEFIAMLKDHFIECPPVLFENRK